MLTLRAKLIAGAILAVALIVGSLVFRETIAAALSGHTRARLSTNQARAGAESGHDAVETSGARAASDRDTDRTVGDTQDAIAHARTVRDIDAAGRLGLCKLRRDDLRGTDCVQFTPAKRLEEGR